MKEILTNVEANDNKRLTGVEQCKGESNVLVTTHGEMMPYDTE